MGPTLRNLSGSGDWRQLTTDDASPVPTQVHTIPTAALPGGFASQFITEALKPREGM